MKPRRWGIGATFPPSNFPSDPAPGPPFGPRAHRGVNAAPKSRASGKNYYFAEKMRRKGPKRVTFTR